MASMSDAERRAESERAVKQRFPEKARVIDELFGNDENFRDMCEELAEIDRALSAPDRVPATHREARMAEWREWKNRLIAEIGEALDRANVVSFNMKRPSGQS